MERSDSPPPDSSDSPDVPDSPDTPSSPGSPGSSDSSEPTETIDVSEVKDPADPVETSTALVDTGDSPPANLFLVPHESIVVFPDLVAPLSLQSELAKKTIEQAESQSSFIGCILSKTELGDGEVVADDLYDVGCAARIIRTLRMPDDSVSVVVRGMKRFRTKKLLRSKPVVIAKVEYPDESDSAEEESEAMMRVLRGIVRKLLASDESVPDEFKMAAANVETPKAMADFAASYFVRDAPQRQELLEAFDAHARLERVITILTREVGLMELGQKIQDRIRQRLEEQQRDFFLREQLKEIRKELGEAKDEKAVAIERLQEKLAGITLPEEAQARVDEEVERLSILPLESPEAAVIRNYLDWISALPWSTTTDDRKDLAAAEKILREGHFGLDEVKERILEFLAVRKLKPDHRGPILCFAGPPGVGKTSLGRSIAESLGRKFVRISLGGIRDEAEIRGHRRTYVGALPGRILQGLKAAGSNNPVFMLDELDKLGGDFRGDPSSALLEALDPEQNDRFSDHFLELSFDLSKVMFVATANNLAAVPAPLLDRLEIIELPGYTTNEKIGIARKYLLPRQIDRHGLKRKNVKLSNPALRSLLHGWTREAGVRHLEQRLAKICRKLATKAARSRARAWSLGPKDLEKLLGPAPFLESRVIVADRPGVVVGLSWTPVGGDALSVEATKTPGHGQFQLTGMLGDVMLESARIALSHVRAKGDAYGFPPPDLKKLDLHLHVPSGAVPKDGPSAGITMATALVSLFRGRKIKARVAMTGELTLTGRVLPVGGLRNKVLAARRAGMKEVIVPAQNRPDIEELTEEARRGLLFHFVEEFGEVVALVFPKRSRS